MLICSLALVGTWEIEVGVQGSESCPEQSQYGLRSCGKPAIALHQLDPDILDDDTPCYEWRCAEHSCGLLE